MSVFARRARSSNVTLIEGARSPPLGVITNTPEFSPCGGNYFTTDNGAEVFIWTPFKNTKGTVGEGGCRVPAIIRRARSRQALSIEIEPAPGHELETQMTVDQPSQEPTGGNHPQGAGGGNHDGPANDR